MVFFMTDVFLVLELLSKSHPRVTWAKLRDRVARREKTPANGSREKLTVVRPQ
jgi:hypothetical protein